MLTHLFIYTVALVLRLLPFFCFIIHNQISACFNPITMLWILRMSLTFTHTNIWHRYAQAQFNTYAYTLPQFLFFSITSSHIHVWCLLTKSDFIEWSSSSFPISVCPPLSLAKHHCHTSMHYHTLNTCPIDLTLQLDAPTYVLLMGTNNIRNIN